MFIIGMMYDGFDDQLEVLRHTSALVFQLESVSSVCGRTTYFPLGQSRQNRPGASQNFHVTKAGPRTPWLPPAIVWIGAFPGGHSPSRLRFLSKAFRQLTVYSRRNALSLRKGVSIGKLPALKAACRPIPKASPARGGAPKGRRGSVPHAPKPPSAERGQPPSWAAGGYSHKPHSPVPHIKAHLLASFRRRRGTARQRRVVQDKLPRRPLSRSFEQLFAHKHTQKGACTSAHSPSSVYIPNYTVSSCFSPSTSACSFSSG